MVRGWCLDLAAELMVSWVLLFGFGRVRSSSRKGDVWIFGWGRGAAFGVSDRRWLVWFGSVRLRYFWVFWLCKVLLHRVIPSEMSGSAVEAFGGGNDRSGLMRGELSVWARRLWNRRVWGLGASLTVNDNLE